MSEPILAPNSSWFSQGGTTITRSSITEIEIVDSYTPTGNETASWDASAALDGSVMAYVTGTKLTLAGNGTGCIYANPDSTKLFSDPNKTDYFANAAGIVGLSILDTSRVTTMNTMFSGVGFKTIDVSGWDVSKVTDMAGMFQYCVVTELDLPWNTSSLILANHMFNKCYNLTSITGLEKWDTSHITTMKVMFGKCISLISLTNISGWNTSAVTDMSSMFEGNDYVGDMNLAELDLSSWDVSNVVKANHMFYGCSKLTKLDLSKWNTGKMVDINHMFCDCWGLTEVKISNWDVSNCQLFYALFNDCNKLTTIDLSGWKTSSARTFAQMFERCTSLTKIIGLENFVTTTLNCNTPVVDENGNVLEGTYAELYEMFRSCSSLTEIDLSSFDARNVSDTQYMFLDCTNLKTVYVSDLWSTESVTASTDMFKGCTSLVGEDGTVYDSSQITAEYARVDNGTDAPGYFTHINNKDGNAVLVQSKSLYQAAKAIRDVSGNTDKYKPSEMAVAIRTLAKPDTPIVGDPVAQIGDITYASVTAALAEAQPGQMVTMISNATDKNIVIPSGVTLNLGAYHLTANSVTGLDGGNIVANAESSEGVGGRLIVAKENLKLHTSNPVGIERPDLFVVPIWLDGYYVFSLCKPVFNYVRQSSDGLNAEASISISWSGHIRKNVLIDGAEDNGIHIIGLYEYPSANDCTAIFQLKYSDSLVKTAAQSATSQLFYTDKYKENMIFYAKVVSDCGVEITTEQAVITS